MEIFIFVVGFFRLFDFFVQPDAGTKQASTSKEMKKLVFEQTQKMSKHCDLCVDKSWEFSSLSQGSSDFLTLLCSLKPEQSRLPHQKKLKSSYFDQTQKMSKHCNLYVNDCLNSGQLVSLSSPPYSQPANNPLWTNLICSLKSS